jgi:FtsZ-binding cell division protein ZapB
MAEGMSRREAIAECKKMGRLDEAEEEEPMDEEIELDEESIMEMVSSMLSEGGEAPHPYDDPHDDFNVRNKKAKEQRRTRDRVKRKAYEDEYNQGKPYQEGEEEDGELYEELSDALLEAIMEKLTVDMGATLSGWAGRSDDDMKHQMELEMAHRRSTEVAEELEALKKAQEELVFENKKLKENLSNYQEVVESLKENVQDVNLSNARLLYTNRTLRNTSLNERQKERIVEAISKAGSVEEAKTIHETLQSTVASTPKRGPQSLSEAITRPTSIIRASRKEEPKADPFQARMRKLAGIN